jgi:hypothetical protein
MANPSIREGHYGSGTERMGKANMAKQQLRPNLKKATTNKKNFGEESNQSTPKYK